MAKRRRTSFSKKSARDKAIDQALLAAAKITSADGGGSVIVRLTKGGATANATPNKSTITKPATIAANPKTAMAMALADAGLAPAAQADKPKAQQPPSKPPKPLDAPAAAKAPPPPAAKPKPPKALSKPKAKQPKKAKKPTKPTPSNFMNREALAAARAEEDRKFRKVVAQEGRAERLLERQKAAAREISNIGLMAPDALLELWRANFALTDTPQSAFYALAMDYIAAVESEWTRRSIIARLDPDYFKWPSTSAQPGNGAFGELVHAEGILGYLGYHVGKTGESSPARRQALLARVFEGSLPPINGPDYMLEWDTPGKSMRLRKMADSIASLARSAKRKHHADYSLAIEHWEEDLRFLYRKYYVGRFGFDWPSLAADHK